MNFSDYGLTSLQEQIINSRLDWYKDFINGDLNTNHTYIMPMKNKIIICLTFNDIDDTFFQLNLSISKKGKILKETAESFVYEDDKI